MVISIEKTSRESSLSSQAPERCKGNLESLKLELTIPDGPKHIRNLPKRYFNSDMSTIMIRSAMSDSIEGFVISWSMCIRGVET